MLPGVALNGFGSVVGIMLLGVAGAVEGAGVAPTGAAGVAEGLSGAAGSEDDEELNQPFMVLTELETDDEKADVNVPNDRCPAGVAK